MNANYEYDSQAFSSESEPYGVALNHKLLGKLDENPQ